MLKQNHFVIGSIDEETRCKHYQLEQDRVAIRFYCCNTYFSCFACHEKKGCGQSVVWPKYKYATKAILCGSCQYEMRIDEYLACNHECPNCDRHFNPGCRLHKHLYFE